MYAASSSGTTYQQIHPGTQINTCTLTLGHSPGETGLVGCLSDNNKWVLKWTFYGWDTLPLTQPKVLKQWGITGPLKYFNM